MKKTKISFKLLFVLIISFSLLLQKFQIECFLLNNKIYFIRDTLKNFLTENFRVYSDFLNLYSKNILLKTELKKLQQQIVYWQSQQKLLYELKKENADLKRINKVKELNSNYEYSKVLYKIIEPARIRIFIDKGKDYNIKKSSAFINIKNNKQYLIGMVKQVYSDYSEVIYITDPLFSAGAKIQDIKNLNFIVSGYKLDILKSEIFEEMPIGNLKDKIILTSNYSTIFPENLLLGKIYKTEILHDRIKIFAYSIIDINVIKDGFIIK